jgi:pyruvate dehydrogenase E2 component (dihydrolipoyllysine-residue acetyltransferase)
MASEVTMPRLSDSMEEGTVLKWLVDEGAEVKRGEPLVEIETDKANMTYDADSDGTLIEILAQEGDTLAIGEPIARIGDASEASGNGRPSADESEEAPADAEAEDEDEDAEESPETEVSDDDEKAAAKGESRGGGGAEDGGGETQAGGTATKTREPSGNGAGDGGRVKASPIARRMASELGVELAQLEGSGPGGRIVKADVQAASEAGTATKGDGAQADGAEAEAATQEAPEEDKAEERREPQKTEAGPKGEAEIQELTRLQQTVSRRMAESKATAPDFSISLTVDMTQAVELRRRLKEVADPAPSFNDMVVKAAATALREHPRVNGAYRDGKFELYEKVNIGVAVAAMDALVVPTIFDADRKSLGQIARDARAIIEKVRDKTVTPPELSGGTFTVSNLGMYGIEHFTAIINPPQASILTVGALAKRPAVDDNGRIVARDQMSLSLVCDHRILYGADGAQFLARVKELLEQPLSLAL